MSTHATMTQNEDGSFTYEETSGTIGAAADASHDEGQPAPYSDDELDAARTEAVAYFKAQGPLPEQKELDNRAAESERLKTKANEVHREANGSVTRKADGTPLYVVGDLERARLLRAAKGIDDLMPDYQTQLSRSVAQRYLAKRDAQAIVRGNDQDNTAAEKRAREIVIERAANRIANQMEKDAKVGR